MARTSEERIEALLDQLENPGLSQRDIDLIERKIEVLKQHAE